jgi:hypothetical protein
MRIEAGSFRAKKSHPLEWLFEALEDHPTYFRRRMFGSECAYLDGKLMIALPVAEEPWNGMLVATSREQHASLQATWSGLKPHPVLGKWLYISQNDPAFEKTAAAIVKSIRKGDGRIGVEPKPRKRKTKKPDGRKT